MLAPKSIALLVVGVIIISTLFSVFQVTYPTGNPVAPPIQPKQYQLFQVQFQDKNLLGATSTSFAPTGNGTITIEGYVHSANGSIVKPIGNSYLYAAVFPAETNYLTSANGFYKITVLKYGHGTFAFQVPGYNPEHYKISLYGVSVYWLNITLQKAQKYTISGTTVDQAGHTVPTANLTFSDFTQTFNSESSSTGKYSLSVYNGTYVVTDRKAGFSPQPTPYTMTISGAGKSNFKLTLSPLSTPSYSISGYVHNVKGAPIKGAIVTSSTINNTTQTDSAGYYKIDVPFGMNIVMGYATGYGYNYTQVFVQTNLTDINLTLVNNNPLGNSGSGAINGTGLSGVPPGTVKNITGALGNGTSSVNYGNNTTSGNGSGGGSGGSSGGNGGPVSGMFLFGNVTNSNNSAPVVDTYLYFYINVNGTYFYEGVMTNSTGFYSLAVSYTGHYTFYVYSPLYENYTFSIWINSSTYRDISLSPLPGKVYHVSGRLANILDGKGIPGNVTVYPFGSSNPMLQRNTNTSGFYSAYLIMGNYSMAATSPGFARSWNNTTLQPLVSNLVKNFTLTPVSSVGSGVTLWGQNGSTGIPGVSSTNVSSLLNNSSGGSTLATGVRTVNLTVQMVNATSGLPIAYTNYEMYLKLNGVDYNYSGITNGNGNSTLILAYTGNYTLLAEMFYYYGKTVSLNLTGDRSIIMDMYPRMLENLNITLANAYNLTNGGTVPVPGNYLNITNYKQGLYRMPSVVQLSGVGTVFNYTLPEGNYSFTYANANYVTHSFWANVSNTYNNTTQHIRPYLVIVNSNTSANFSYLISGLAPLGTPVPGNSSGYRDYYAATSKVSYSFLAVLGGNPIYSRTVSLTSTYPVANIYVNISSSSTNAPVGNTKMSQNGSIYHEIVPYQVSLSGGYIYRATVNYSVGTNASLMIGGIQQGITESGGVFNLTTYYNSTAGTSLFTTQSDYLGFTDWYNNMPGINSSAITVYVYHTSTAFEKSTGGI